MRYKVTGYELWRGRSRFNGRRIVVIMTIKSGNDKTGNMVQVWILCQDEPPHLAVKSGADAAICGNCRFRRTADGGCYVMPFQGPLSVYRAWKRGAYPIASAEVVREVCKGRKVRMGAYGDPVAAPLWVFQRLADASAGWTGYTHAWRRSMARGFRGLLMASVESIEGARKAQSAGWRTFRGTAPGAMLLGSELLCLSELKGLSCLKCGRCNGAKLGGAKQPKSFTIPVHGFNSAAALRVVS